jgi:hypothetical protein
MEPDFSGWATKANLVCSDGRTIMPDAFKHMDGQTVPLVWQHSHTNPENILGRAVLRHKAEGVMADCYFNNTAAAQHVKESIKHGDIKALSIYANQLVEQSKRVMHGMIREVSLVLAGANPGAFIDPVTIRHSDGDISEIDDAAIIGTGESFSHSSDARTNTDGTDSTGTDNANEPTAQEIWDSMTPIQQKLVEAVAESAAQTAQDPDGDGDNDAEAGVEADNSAEHSENNNNSGEDDLSHQGGAGPMTRNVFEQRTTGSEPTEKRLSHSQMKEILDLAQRGGGVSSLRDLVNEYAFSHDVFKADELAHGIEPIDVLFPNFQNLTNTPQFNQRRTEWVEGVLNKCSKSPFSNVRSIVADITQDEARAMGYIKGNYKKEEWFTVTKRTTGPTTVYKKQKIDRDDVIDITDFDVVAWMKGEMALMLREEVARAILISDGRDIADPDKISDPAAASSGNGVRSIVNEHELYKTDVFVNLGDSNSSYVEVIDAVVRSMRFYKGTGTPTFYTTLPTLANMLLVKDTLGRRLYNNKSELAAAMLVDDIVPVEVMETLPNVIGIIVNMVDYNIGANKGGEVSMFDFFDIDYNQYKYLTETRISGSLVKVKSALVVQTTAATNVVASPIAPTFVKATGVVTIPTVTGVVYKNMANNATLTAGAQTALTAGQELNVFAVPASGYYFETDGMGNEWHFEVGSTTSTS